MKSFSYMESNVTPQFFYTIVTEIQNLKWYFTRFANSNADEAMQRTLMHTITHFNESKGTLSGYVKKLAREITKDSGKVVCVDFLEQTLSEDEDNVKVASVDAGRTLDISTEVIEKLMLESNDGTDIINLSLGFMDKFLVLCEAIRNRDTSTNYYPDVFVKESLKLSKKYPSFNKDCLKLYDTVADEMKKFLSLDVNNDGVWKEADYLQLRLNKSKRIKFRNRKTGAEVEDADKEDYYLDGNLVGKFVVRVAYEDLWEQMCDLIDSYEINVMKFIIGNQYIIRTLGGSLSVTNPDLFGMYDLLRNEIVTNVQKDTNGRILNVGSSYVYMLCTDRSFEEMPKRTIRGIEIGLTAEDITESLTSR